MLGLVGSMSGHQRGTTLVALVESLDTLTRLSSPPPTSMAILQQSQCIRLLPLTLRVSLEVSPACSKYFWAIKLDISSRSLKGYFNLETMHK